MAVEAGVEAGVVLVVAEDWVASGGMAGLAVMTAGARVCHPAPLAVAWVAASKAVGCAARARVGGSMAGGSKVPTAMMAACKEGCAMAAVAMVARWEQAAEDLVAAAAEER